MVDSDLGLGTLWKVDDQGRYEALWEIPLHLRRGRYRIVVSANRYRLASRPFRVLPARRLAVRRVEGGVTLDYPAAVRDEDLRQRPTSASGGTVRYWQDDRIVTLRRRRGTVFPVPEGATLASARDRFGNRALTSSAP